MKKYRNTSVAMITDPLKSSDVFHPLLQGTSLGFKFRGTERCSWKKGERRIKFHIMQAGASVIVQGWQNEDTIVSTFSTCIEFLLVLHHPYTSSRLCLNLPTVEVPSYQISIQNQPQAKLHSSVNSRTFSAQESYRLSNPISLQHERNIRDLYLSSSEQRSSIRLP